MEKALLAFVAKYLGVPNTGDTDANRGQCVGLIEAWLDTNKLQHIWGNAAQLMANADTRIYNTIVNGPSNFPPPGAILVWGPSWGDGDGHTAVVLAATPEWVAVFEQNDPLGAAPVVATHSYAGVVGWVVPKAWAKS